MRDIKIHPCPFCGKTPTDADFQEGERSRVELRHHCFENVRGNYIAVRSVIVHGWGRDEAKDNWNRRTDKNDVSA